MNYADYPLVKLKALLEQEEWFQLANGSTGMAANIPIVWLEVHLKYKDENVRISLDYDVNRPGIRPGIKIGPAFNVKGKSKRRSTPEKALIAVRENFAEAISKIDKQKEEEKRIKEEHDAAIAQRDEVINSFTSTVTPKSTYEEFVLQFKVSKRFFFNFYQQNDGTFTIQNISGTFQQEQVQKLIDWLGTCPEATADRLLNGK
jgi:hypothetical protein